MKRRTRLLAAVTLSAFTLSACLEGGLGFEDASLLSAEEQQIRQIEQRRLTQAIGVGCLIGGLSGLVLGNDENRGQNVLVGTVVGCAVGFAAGQYVNTRVMQFGSAQAQSNALIAAADQDIAQYRSLNSTTRRLISQQRSKVASLNRQLSQGQIDATQYRAQIASADRNIRTLSNQSRAITDQINVMRSDAGAIAQNGGNAGALNTRIRRLEAEQRDLDSQRRALSRIYGGVPNEVGLDL